MAIQIKDTTTLSQKFAARAANAAPDYKTGVLAPRRPWAASALAAAPTWASGVQAAITAGSFAKGVTRVGDPKWQTMASGKGALHYPDGVRAAAPAWATGVGPFLALLAGLSLPPRGIRGSDANYARSKAVGVALHSKKTGGP